MNQQLSALPFTYGLFYLLNVFGPIACRLVYLEIRKKDEDKQKIAQAI
jgi:hypothetical protein